MTPQATNKREGGLTSCHGRSWKELETVKAAPKLLGALTIGGGSARSRGWWWRELKEANKPPSWPKYTKTGLKTGGFLHFCPKNAVFHLQVLNKIYVCTPKMFFREHVNFKISRYLTVFLAR
jgi:hypothetical protein